MLYLIIVLTNNFELFIIVKMYTVYFPSLTKLLSVMVNRLSYYYI